MSPRPYAESQRSSRRMQTSLPGSSRTRSDGMQHGGAHLHHRRDLRPRESEGGTETYAPASLLFLAGEAAQREFFLARSLLAYLARDSLDVSEDLVPEPAEILLGGETLGQ